MTYRDGYAISIAAPLIAVMIVLGNALVAMTPLERAIRAGRERHLRYSSTASGQYDELLAREVIAAALADDEATTAEALDQSDARQLALIRELLKKEETWAKNPFHTSDIASLLRLYDQRLAALRRHILGDQP